ncbi:MAG: TPM domain-containing protein, partial [Oscillospiraceae bacterium]
VLLLIDMENRLLHIVTKGAAIDLLNDARLDEILNEIYPDVQSGDYVAAVEHFVAGVEVCVKRGMEDGQHRYDAQTGEITRLRVLRPWELIVAIAVAALVACGVCASVTARYHMNNVPETYDFRKHGQLELNEQTDTFLHRTVTSRRIPPPSKGSSGGGSSAGRSTVHTSSSGHTYGGRSKEF